MLTKPGHLAECFGNRFVARAVAVCPRLWLERIYHILAAHHVDICAAQVSAQFLILMLRVKTQNAFSCFTQIAQQELHQIRFSLTAVAEDKCITVGLILSSFIKVHKHITTILVPAEIKTVFIGLATIIQRIHICHRACRQHSLILRSETVCACRHSGKKALLLTEYKAVDRYFRACKLHLNIRLQFFELIKTACTKLNKHSAMQQRLLVAAEFAYQFHHIIDVILSLN